MHRSLRGRRVMCPACGARVEADDRYCTSCGRPLRGAGGSVTDADRDELARSAPAVPAAWEAADRPDRDRGAAAAGGTTPIGAATTRMPALPPDGPDLRRCPLCGAANSPRRALCGRCGADLDSGQAPPTVGASADAEPEGVVGMRERRRWLPWVVVLVAAAVIGTLIGALVYIRFGLMAGEAATPVFDPAVYPEEPAPLAVSDATASSTKVEGDVPRDADLAVDGDPATAWAEGAPGPGEGASLHLRLARRSWVEAVVVRNGDQRDDATFSASARASKVLSSFDGRPAFEITLTDVSGEQLVRLPEPQLASLVSLQVLQAVPDGGSDELAISEVVLTGWAARGADRDPA
ncbi:MAG TPA: zinc ribbon domain-containing protein [Nitriliruptorales bacterium]|nr:zinc ribbon domain-containing protein [Nitriliruptorales bacterium]